MSDAPRDAASVILVRESEARGELEVLLVCRHRGSGFMASSYVFPGGVAEEGDAGDLKVTAARELFEESGILLADRTFTGDERARMRESLNAGVSADDIFADTGARFQTQKLRYFAHWMTPTIEKRRFSARFFLARLPDGQEASAGGGETVDHVWLAPEDALARAKALKLPPPQVRTFQDIRAAIRGGWASLQAVIAEREKSPAIILPRFAPIASSGGAPFALLLPWDPDYDRLGTGDSIPIAADHPLATGPSRFVLEDETWKHTSAPSSAAAE